MSRSSTFRVGRTREEWAAHDALAAAIRRTEAGGLIVPCRTDERRLWISGRADDRRTAAALCGDCPVTLDCRRAGRPEHAGVWGGTDRDTTGGGDTMTKIITRTAVGLAGALLALAALSAAPAHAAAGQQSNGFAPGKASNGYPSTR